MPFNVLIVRAGKAFAYGLVVVAVVLIVALMIVVASRP
jgi:hypothetical protein